MLMMLSSCRLYIWARWKADILPSGESINTLMPRLPRRAYSAAEPVSPLVAPRMLSVWFSLASTYSKALPKNCIAMSLNASVGPLDRAWILMPSLSVRTGVISALPNVSRV